MATAGFFIEGRKIRNFADIQRNFLYEISFKNAHKFIPNWDEESITLRARSFSIPQRGNEAITSEFGAMKQFFPGKPTFGNTMQVTFEETESQNVQTFLFKWQQAIFDLNVGHARSERKRIGITATTGGGYCDAVTIKAFRYNGEELENKYFLYNVWLQNVDDVSLDYSQNEAVKFNATFQFDFWTYGNKEPSFATTAAESTTDTNITYNAGVNENASGK